MKNENKSQFCFLSLPDRVRSPNTFHLLKQLWQEYSVWWETDIQITPLLPLINFIMSDRALIFSVHGSSQASCTWKDALVRFMTTAVTSLTLLHQKSLILYSDSVMHYAANIDTLSAYVKVQVWRYRLMWSRIWGDVNLTRPFSPNVRVSDWNISHDSLLPLPFSLWLMSNTWRLVVRLLPGIKLVPSESSEIFFPILTCLLRNHIACGDVSIILQFRYSAGGSGLQSEYEGHKDPEQWHAWQ